MAENKYHLEHINRYYEERRKCLERALEISDEMIACLEEMGLDVENAKFEDTIKYIEQWEERMKKRREEEK